MSSFCLGCGNSVPENERYCAVCGRDQQAGAAVARIDPQVAFGLAPETSGKAIFSLVCGILFLIPPVGLVAVIFGHLALSEIKKSAGRFTGKGLAVTGIVLGYVGVACLLGFIGLGFYGLWEERQVASRGQSIYTATSEKSVVSSVRSLNMAEIAYSQAHKEKGYTCSLSDLKDVWGLSAELTAGRKNGYIYEIQGCEAEKPDGPIVKYRLIAHPEATGKKSLAVYCSDESDIIRVARNGSMQDCLQKELNLPEVKATPGQ